MTLANIKSKNWQHLSLEEEVQYTQEFLRDKKLQKEFALDGLAYLSFRNEEAAKAAKDATIKGRGTTTYPPLTPAEIEVLKTEFAASESLQAEFRLGGVDGYLAFKDAEHQGKIRGSLPQG